MKIAWIQDYNPFQHIGMGGETNDYNMINYGIRKGYDIQVITPQTFGLANIKDLDLIIISNCCGFTEEQMKTITQQPHIFFHHDFLLICKYRLYYPAIQKCFKKCSWWMRKYLSKAKLHVFLSPLHYKLHKQAMGNKVEPHAIVPSAFGSELNTFQDNGFAREKNSVLLVNPYTFKSADNAIEYFSKHKGYRVYWCGNTDCEDKLSGFTKLGHIPYHEMYRIYNRCEYFFHVPKNYEPFGRVMVEAYLSGCKLITCNRVGALSYKWFRDKERLRKEVSEALKKFWEAIG
ncbi:MAG: hypothetical protein AB1779_06290 [Candidatus Thermoplasmatota archaeon]